MNATVKLLRIIGSPFTPMTEMARDDSEALELYNCAIKNRIPLLYLETLRNQERLGELKGDYNIRQKRYLRMLNTMASVSDFLESKNVESAIFKTIRPYPAVANDIDIICLGSDKEYQRAKEALFQAGYRRVLDTPGPRQIKLVHSKERIWIDLHKNIGVSGIVCIDRKRLNKYKASVELPNGKRVSALMPQADLAIVMLHSIVNEQLYTIGEFYATILSLGNMTSPEIDSFINIVKENNITSAARTHLSLTATLHEGVFGTLPENLDKVLSKLGRQTPETSRFKKNDFKTPHRYRLLTVTGSLLEKMKDRETRRSIPSQMLRMTNPKFLKTLIRDIRDHKVREAQEEVYKISSIGKDG